MLLNDGEIAELRSIFTSALFDTCVLQTRVEGGGGYGYGQPAYTNGAPVACLFEPNRTLTDEVPGAQAQVIDGAILLNQGTVIAPTMRLKITHLHGDAVAPAQVYEIIGGPMLNHVGVRVKVKLVTDGSES